MTQKAIVKEVLSDTVVRVALMRQLECGLNCSSCGDCLQKPSDEHCANADNSTVNARPGDLVEVVSSFASVYLAAFYVFILPCLGLLVGYLLARWTGLGQGLCVVASLMSAVLCFVPALLFNRKQKRGNKPEFSIVRILR